MKKATTKDVVALTRVIVKLDLKEEFNSIQKGNNDVESVGFQAFYKIIERIVDDEIENEFYKALSRPFEMTIDEVGDMPINELIEAFKDCYNIPALVNFIKQVMK